MFGANLALDGSGCAVESYHKFPVMANSINWIHFRLPTKSRKELEHASTEVSDWAILRKCKTNTYLLMREWPRQFKKLKLDPFILTRTACRKQTHIFQPHAASLIKLVFYNSGLTHRENDTHSGLHSPNHEKPSSVSRGRMGLECLLNLHLHVHCWHSIEAQEKDVQKEHFWYFGLW